MMRALRLKNVAVVYVEVCSREQQVSQSA
jgi:hypothetical protein